MSTSKVSAIDAHKDIENKCKNPNQTKNYPSKNIHIHNHLVKKNIAYQRDPKTMKLMNYFYFKEICNKIFYTCIRKNVKI